MRLLKIIVFLILLAGVGLVGFAYFGNLSPERAQISVPVDLDDQ